MTPDGLLMSHGSAFILPLAIIEGPVVAILTGFLSAQGVFDWRWTLVLLVCGDLIGDVLFYWAGHSGRTRLAGLGRWLGINGFLTPAIEHGLRHNAARMLLIGKWTHSVGCVVLVGSGMLRVHLPLFLLVNLLATVPKTAVLFGFGYFAGDSFPPIERHAGLAMAALCLLGIAAIALTFRRLLANGAGR